MPDFRIVLVGPPYKEPRFYGELGWNARNVYLRHPDGAKDSRHRDGNTFLTSTGSQRSHELRVPTSAASRELINFIALKATMPEPRILDGPIRKSDLIIPTTSAGTAPRLAV